VETFVTAVADQEIVCIRSLVTTHALLTLQTEPGLGLDAGYQSRRILETRRMTAVSTFVARQKIFLLFVPISFRGAETETADGTRLHFGLGKYFHWENRNSKLTTVFLQKALFELFGYCRFELVSDFPTLYQAILTADLGLYLTKSGPF
jgi:hypothetical protein